MEISLVTSTCEPAPMEKCTISSGPFILFKRDSSVQNYFPIHLILGWTDPLMLYTTKQAWTHWCFEWMKGSGSVFSRRLYQRWTVSTETNMVMIKEHLTVGAAPSAWVRATPQTSWCSGLLPWPPSPPLWPPKLPPLKRLGSFAWKIDIAKKWACCINCLSQSQPGRERTIPST